MSESTQTQSANVFGVVPSRRLGRSLGISPIPTKTCNYSCVYCQLGRTLRYARERQMYYSVEDIAAQLRQYIESLDSEQYDVVTVVGDGEPTLYLGLGRLIDEIRATQTKPVAVISNGALLFRPDVREEVSRADIVMLNFDSWNQESLKRINRPLSELTFLKRMQGYREFTDEFGGLLYLEVMMVKGLNDSDSALENLARLARELDPDKIFVNTPVRPPAESWVEIPDQERLAKAAETFGGSRIDYLPEGMFISLSEDPVNGILNIISRHPMRLEDIRALLTGRAPPEDVDRLLETIRRELASNESVETVRYRSSIFYRVRKPAARRKRNE
ncbi:MAG: radical SAM protein [Candidatus Thorarchaeota archaeon]